MQPQEGSQFRAGVTLPTLNLSKGVCAPGASGKGQWTEGQGRGQRDSRGGGSSNGGLRSEETQTRRCWDAKTSATELLGGWGWGVEGDAYPQELHGHKAEPLLLEALDDFAHQSALHAIWLDGDEGTLCVGHSPADERSSKGPGPLRPAPDPSPRGRSPHPG